MSDGLFHLDSQGKLAALTVTPYAAEEALQQLVETHPDLLAGGQMTPDAPRRWALVRREHGVPDHDEANGSRWSVDHLFVDQDAVPTLVEVKRSTDTRIRREVVGQMLDYAANGVRYWPVDQLRSAFDATQNDAGRAPEEEIAALTLNPDLTLDEFFVSVADNLRAGRIRMVFVADRVPDELRRITEFLNEQMNPAEVYAVEVKTYRADGQGDMVIVPTVYGRTATASIKTAARHSVDRATLMERSKSSTVELLELIDNYAAARGLVAHHTPGGSILKTSSGDSIASVYLARWDRIQVPLQPLRNRGWSEQADRILAELQAMTSSALTEKNPMVPSEDAVQHWDTMEVLIDEITDLYRSIEETTREPQSPH
ncbi:MAG: hypothetical protein GX632_11625 [Propioniciclava sp.]|nr:hypothetical protein [Propioniciclava sp.]